MHLELYKLQDAKTKQSCNRGYELTYHNLMIYCPFRKRHQSVGVRRRLRPDFNFWAPGFDGQQFVTKIVNQIYFLPSIDI